MDFIRKHPRIALFLALLILFLGVGLDNRLKVVHYVIESSKISKQIRIALVTDLHSCDYGENQKDLVSALGDQNPDVILLGGDIFDDVLSDDNTLAFLDGIQGMAPTFYVSGNHEIWSRRYGEMAEQLKKRGVTILSGTNHQLTVGNQTISISGIDDPDYFTYEDSSQSTTSQLERATIEIQDDHFQILLAHRPESIKMYQKYPFDLVLSGHAHGGQWRIPYLLNGLFAPNQGFFPKYAGGYYQLGQLDFIVSRGLARESTRLPRLYNRPELVIVDVK